MLINFSNHPSEFWGLKQLDAAKEYGEVIDIPFPAVDPESNHNEIKDLACKCVENILSYAKDNQIIVHVMGEMTFTFLVVSMLKERDVECIASTTDRNSEMLSDSQKISDFQFVRFRKY